MEHDEWFQARYPNGKSEYYRQKYLEAKRPAWDKSNEERRQRKANSKRLFVKRK